MKSVVAKYLHRNGIQNANITIDRSNGVKSLTIKVEQGLDGLCDDLLSRIKNAEVKSFEPCKFHLTFK